MGAGRCRVTFLPHGLETEVEEGTDLLQAAARAGVELRSVCGGEGVCGRCTVAVRRGRVAGGEGNLPPEARRQGYVLACRALVQGDVEVEVPPEARVAEPEVLLDRLSRREVLAESHLEGEEAYPREPLVRRLPVELEPPTLIENASDLARLTAQVRRLTGAHEVEVPLGVLRRLPHTLRAGEWTVSVTLQELQPGRLKLLEVEPGASRRPLCGLAVDIGTTTVSTLLLDLETGYTLDRRGTYNRQHRFGADVISRIIHATEVEGGLGQLQAAALETINGLVGQALDRRGLEPGDIRAVVAAGNTTMTHLFLGIPPGWIRLEPYIPAASTLPVVTAGELGLMAHPQAPVVSLPAVASYVGGDIVAGVLVTGVGLSPRTSLFIDIGTNGEMVLGNREWMVACACSAGPCFEGSGVSCGMQAAPGAIQRVEVDPESLEVTVSTVGGEKPLGICGSGLVDLLSKIHRARVIDRAGRLQPVRSPRRRDGEEGPEFVLAWASQGNGRRDIVIRESDVQNLLRAKGAVFAGIRSLLKAADLPPDGVERIFIAGGFGNYLNLRDAINIGLLPDLPPERYRFSGNTSLKGARLALLSRPALEDAHQIARRMTYLELSVGAGFMEEFTSALFIPHTDLGLFPSVKE
ncbi:MAG: ASKHA domain-containing protein [Acetobacteraceae bacterium]|nr:ASKHA domain-containing protein [Acetobacteraceae bacterium]